MNKIKIYTLNALIIIFMATLPIFTSCNDDKFEETIFEIEDDLDETSERYEFEMWLRENYLKPYNVEFRYRMNYFSTNIQYNLSPMEFDKAQEMAVLIKNLWFDVYDVIAGKEFLQMYSPRIIQLIGSRGYSSANTEVAGTAEGGIMVTLYAGNSVDRTDLSVLNSYYFSTMHHEFAHILHQTKAYPIDFKAVSMGNYNSAGWNYVDNYDSRQLGFVSSYASKEPDEDLAETFSIYITSSDAEWQQIMDDAGESGGAIINTKLEICKSWMRQAWNIDMEVLRAEIQTRQENIENIENPFQ